MPRTDFLEQLAERFVTALVAKMKDGAPARGAKGGNGRRGASPLKGRKLDMRCRYPGCKNRSKGPKFHFLCEKHLKNPGWPAAKKAIAKAA